MKNKSPRVASALALCLPVLAQAQPTPVETKSPGAAPRYESAFTHYKPWKAISAGNWRAANEAVGVEASGTGHGGHTMTGNGGYTMNMAPTAPGQSANQPPKPAPSPFAPHEGHQMQTPGGQK
ncbi:MAG: hypothetical protein NVS2B4_18450 [Ramlibacter sp.]